ncbi:hypothetical protein [Aeromicrobium sp. CTD01-1L150]|uniref:hypothetical protein n=1 Tax=Aeromicrobium sp. CTD01-1L150 TaxID=3341830 RepID=UPI0035BF371B
MGSPGLSNVDYAPLAELIGRSPFIAPESMHCNPPDPGNMEVLELFDTEERKERWLDPLMASEIASTFAVTEPAAASTDATSIELRMVADGDQYVRSPTSGRSSARCASPGPDEVHKRTISQGGLRRIKPGPGPVRGRWSVGLS